MLKMSVEDVADVDAISDFRLRYQGSQARSHDRINPELAVLDTAMRKFVSGFCWLSVWLRHASRLLCRFLDAGNEEGSARSANRPSKTCTIAEIAPPVHQRPLGYASTQIGAADLKFIVEPRRDSPSKPRRRVDPRQRRFLRSRRI